MQKKKKIRRKEIKNGTGFQCVHTNSLLSYSFRFHFDISQIEGRKLLSKFTSYLWEINIISNNFMTDFSLKAKKINK